MIDFVAFGQTLINQFGLIGIFLMSIIFNASILLPMPGDILIFTAGAAASGTNGAIFGPLLIGLIGGFGAAIGELTSWGLGWITEKKLLRKRLGKRWKVAHEYFEKHGFLGIVFFSFTPLPFDVMGLVAGALQYDPHRFLTATLIGKVPRMLILSYAGFYGTTFIFDLLGKGLL